jgi:hypothetical protein
MTDVVELIVAEHRRIGRLCAALDHAVSHPSRLHPDPAGPVWVRLAELLLLHTDAEEEICFPTLFALAGYGSEQIREAIAGLDDIRAAVAEGRRCRLDSPQWQAAVRWPAGPLWPPGHQQGTAALRWPRHDGRTSYCGSLPALRDTSII